MAAQPLGCAPDQLVDPAGALVDLQAASSHDGHAGGVIAAVLQALEGLEEDGDGILAAHVTDDSAHSTRS
jgi:hypothetical protein